MADGSRAMPAFHGAPAMIQQLLATASMRWPGFPAPGPTATPAAPSTGSAP